jgi:hypothetical protein
VHVPVPLVIVIIAEPLPIPLQTPVVLIATDNPELAVAATVKVDPFAALPGAGVVTVIVCVPFVIVKFVLLVSVYNRLLVTCIL